MRGKVMFVAGAAVGYVLGTRAGRKRYEQIKAAATSLWQTPAVQRQVHTLEGYVTTKITEIPDAVAVIVRKFVKSQGRPETHVYVAVPAQDDDLNASPGKV